MATIEPPPASEPVTIGEEKGFRWIITDLERAHISELLQCDSMFDSQGPERTACRQSLPARVLTILALV